MAGFFQSLWQRFFPFSERQAVKIAIAECSKTCRPDETAFKASTERPPNIYWPTNYPEPKEPCWYVSAPWGDGLEGAILRSSRVIVISKKTGAVLFDGTANDEG
jgi:hypothetical protein